jgi:hypothetical protein
MNYRQAFADLHYCGRVRSVRRAYHVLQGDRGFVVFSPKDRTNGNYTIVPGAAVDYVTRRLGGTRSIATREAFDACHRSKYFGNRFDMLNTLYAMIAIGRAKIARRDAGKLFFGIAKHGS